MGSIEEDIEILNSLLTFKGKGLEYALEKKSIKAIENILQDYTRQKQINEEHQKINGELREKVKELEKESKILEFQNKQIENYAEELKKYNKTVSDRIVEYKKNSIPKQVVIDLIENETINISGFECIAVEDLQELLEGRNENG